MTNSFRNFKRFSRVGIAVFAVAAALALAGCGGSSSSSSSSSSGTVSAATYVKSVCTAASGWANSLRSAITRLEVNAQGTKSLAHGKQLYVSFVDSLLSATSHVQDQLKSAGTPSVSNGSNISSELVNAFGTIKSALATAASKARQLPTSSESAFTSAAAQISQAIRNSEAKLSGLAPQHNPELRAAAAKEPACQQLKSLG